MKYIFFVVTFLSLTACQTTRIKGEKYKVSSFVCELGSIGEPKTDLNLRNDFKARTLPRLKNEIRLSIDIIPFNKNLVKIYNSKSGFNQSQPEISYADSLDVKPELAVIKILDVTGFVRELNAVYNKDISELLSVTPEFQVISSVVLVLSKEDLAKIRQADAYYLLNAQEQKYTISLYKQGKKIDTLEMDSPAVIGYTHSRLCWNLNKGSGHIADLVSNSEHCNGQTKAHVPAKKKKNIYKL